MRFQTFRPPSESKLVQVIDLILLIGINKTMLCCKIRVNVAQDAKPLLAIDQGV